MPLLFKPIEKLLGDENTLIAWLSHFASDINSDGLLDVLDIVGLVNFILNS